MVATTTPKSITRHLRDLCARLKVTAEPTFVPVRSRADAALGDCFNDVKRQVEEFGGELFHGWLLWEWPGILVEAEFHGMWRSPTGDLTDVSLRGEGEEVVLFVPDVSRRFEGSRKDNVRHVTGKDPRIRTFVQNQNRFFKLFQAAHGNVTGEVVLEDELADLLYNQRMLGEALATSVEAQRAWVAFSKDHPYLPQRRLTHRSSGAPTAGHQGPA